VTVKLGEAVGPAHADDGVGEASAGGDQSDGDGVAKASDDADAAADGIGLVAPPTQPATEAVTIRPAMASLMPE
jgi:hypothetical protein